MYKQEPYKVYEGQSMLDVAVAIYGNAQLAFELAYLNSLGVTSILQAGQQIQVFDFKRNNNVLQVYIQANTIPATAMKVGESLVIVNSGGIGFMQVGTNFKVS